MPPHYTPDELRSQFPRFWSKVNFDGPGGCWLWTGSLHPAGYGSLHRHDYAHRVAYENAVGPIPEGLTLDHLCRVRPCVNPAHLEPVTLAENKARGQSAPAQNARRTHCIHGHPFNLFNTAYPPSGGRMCRRCRTRRTTEGRRKKRREAIHNS